MSTNQSIRRMCRQAVASHPACHASINVLVVSGNARPAVKGRSYYWTTPSGKTEVQYPSAYGWPTLYHGSTLRVEVGEDWIRRQLGQQLS